MVRSRINLARELARIDPGAVPLESDYYALWCKAVETACATLDFAVLGGLAADRFAWVFAAGYQAALRCVFADQTFPGWVAYVVSESESARVEWEEHEHAVVVSGTKTWVAGVDTVRDLVVKAGRGGRARYLRIGRNTEGLSLQSKSARFLPELSQGRACFDRVRVDPSSQLDASHVPQFASAEALYVLAAFVAWTFKRGAETTACLGLLEQAAHLDGRCDRSAPEFVRFGREVLALARRVELDNADWHGNQRLLNMYAADGDS